VQCFPAPSWSKCWATACEWPDNWPDYTPERKRIARELADITHFSKDPHVSIVRNAMRNLRDKVAGGNDFIQADVESTELPDVHGMMVDPAVPVPPCGGAGPWAYPSP
jgi:hypothetical protein